MTVIDKQRIAHRDPADAAGERRRGDGMRRRVVFGWNCGSTHAVTFGVRNNPREGRSRSAFWPFQASPRHHRRSSTRWPSSASVLKSSRLVVAD
jgi:hypothetical protein